MLNPSTADECGDHPTVRQMLNRALADNCSVLYVTNTYALIATNPRELDAKADPVGLKNDYWIEEVARGADEIVFASGNRGAGRLRAVYEIVCKANPKAPKYQLGEMLTKRKRPRHPRGTRRDTELREFKPWWLHEGGAED